MIQLRRFLAGAGAALLLGLCCGAFSGGCGGGASEDGTMERDEAELKAEADAMREQMEAAHAPPTGQ